MRWYETRDFVITYQTDRETDGSPFLRWTHLSDTDEIKVSQSGSDDVQTLTPPSHHLGENRFHPLQVLPPVLATIEECTKWGVHVAPPESLDTVGDITFGVSSFPHVSL